MEETTVCLQRDSKGWIGFHAPYCPAMLWEMKRQIPKGRYYWSATECTWYFRQDWARTMAAIVDGIFDTNFHAVLSNAGYGDPAGVRRPVDSRPDPLTLAERYPERPA